jgi:hypothetical protein
MTSTFSIQGDIFQFESILPAGIFIDSFVSNNNQFLFSILVFGFKYISSINELKKITFQLLFFEFTGFIQLV